MNRAEAAELVHSLFADWYPMLVRYALRVTGRLDTADDVVQETFLQPAVTDLSVDGRLDDSFRQSAPVQALSPAETGVPASLGGEVRVRARGRYLCLSARLPEPGGKVLAHSAGRNPIWELDLRTSPPVEDRIVYRLHYRSVAGAERDLTIAINPWGAYRVEEDGKVVASATILRAAQVNPQGWAVEAAVPSTLFDIDWSTRCR
jgi:hypothetical protein